MATLYYNPAKNSVTLTMSDRAIPPGCRLLVKGQIKVTSLMRASTYSIDIGHIRSAIIATPMAINGAVSFSITTYGLSSLPERVFTLEVARAMATLRNSRTLHRLIWDHVGIQRDESIVIGEVTAVRQVPALSEGRQKLRLCEGYLPANRNNIGEDRSLFFITPYNRSLSMVATYTFHRTSDDRMQLEIPGFGLWDR